MTHHRITQIEDYETLIGSENIERIREKARKFKGLRVANFNSTYYGGGVAETISSLTLLMNSLGLRTEWRVIQGTADFFSITKKMHNALQGGEIDLSSIKKEIFEQVIYENSVRNFLEHDFVIVHDPQPLPLIEHYEKKCPWIWRCHIDLSKPDVEMWKYLRHWIDKYDAVIVSCPEYKQEMKPSRRVFMPAIDPFSIKNRQLSDKDIDERLGHYKVSTDLPLVVQISRFDPWKDPEGVVEAFKLARKEVDARLVLLGNFATDDPEGAKIFESLRACQAEHILILTSGDCIANSRGGRFAKIVARRLRTDGRRGDVERDTCHWRKRRRNSLSDRKRREWVSRFLCRRSRRVYRALAEGREIARGNGTEGSRNRAREIPAHPLRRTVSRFFWRVR